MRRYDEDYRCHDHALRMGRPAAAPVRQTYRQDARRPQRAWTGHYQDGRRCGRPLVSRLFESRCELRCGIPDQVSQAPADGTEPARSRAPLSADVGAQPEHDAALHRRRRRGAVGSRRQGRGPADPPHARELPRIDPRLRELGSSAVEGGLCRRGGADQRERLARLQDASARGMAAGHRNLPARAQGGRRQLPSDARQHVVIQLRRGSEGRTCAGGARLLLVRGSARRRRHHQLREAAAEARYPHHGDRVLTRRISGVRAVDHDAGDRFSERATSR